MESQVEQHVREQGSGMALWAGVLGSPAVWALQMLLGYALAPWLCHSRAFFVMYLISALSVLAALIGALLSWRQWKRVGGGSFDDVESGPIGRERFLGGLGIVVSVLFALLIVAQGIPSFFFDGCWI